MGFALSFHVCFTLQCSSAEGLPVSSGLKAGDMELLLAPYVLAAPTVGDPYGVNQDLSPFSDPSPYSPSFQPSDLLSGENASSLMLI